MDFTTTCHLDTYPTISPRRAALSQAGRTVLITGGGSGIGYAIAKSFAEAGAARLILLGRRAETLDMAKEELQSTWGSGVEVLTYPCDICNEDGVQQAWHDLEKTGIIVHVLVLNAATASTTPQGLAESHLVSKVWATFVTNVYAPLLMLDIFLKQGSGTKDKAVVCLGSGSAHIAPVRASQLAYSSSKCSLISLMQGFSDALNPDDTQIITYNPGSVRTESVLRSRLANMPLAWNTDTLAGDFAVWAASKDARFLHGRFVWCNWDVDELRTMNSFQHPGFCRIGLQGPNMLSELDLRGQMEEARKRMPSK